MSTPAPDHPFRAHDFRSRGPLKPADRDEIRARLAEGESAEKLAREYGVSARTIRHQR